MKVFDTITTILKELSGAPTVQASDRLQEDMAMDSLSMVTLLVALEDAFGIELHEADMNPFELTTVQDVVELVRSYMMKDGEMDEA